MRTNSDTIMRLNQHTNPRPTPPIPTDVANIESNQFSTRDIRRQSNGSKVRFYFRLFVAEKQTAKRWSSIRDTSQSEAVFHTTACVILYGVLFGVCPADKREETDGLVQSGWNGIWNELRPSLAINTESWRRERKNDISCVSVLTVNKAAKSRKHQLRKPIVNRITRANRASIAFQIMW